MASSKKRKIKRKIKMAKKEDSRQFRSSMAAILSAFETYGGMINDDHVEVMKRTPFYMLLNAVREGKVSAQDCHRGEAVTADIMYMFNPVEKKFKLGGQDASLTRDDIKLIFGIVDGEVPIKLYKGTKSNWNFYRRWFYDDVFLNPKVVKDKLQIVFFKPDQSKLDIEDAVRMLCLLLCITLFVPLVGFSTTWGWVEFVEDLDRMRDYNWSGKIVTLLIDSLTLNHTDPYKVKGCTMVLPYWLCEHARVMSARDCDEELPRFVRWNLSGLKTVVTRRMLMMIEAEKVVAGGLVSTDVELAMFASLKEYRGERVRKSSGLGRKNKVGDAEGEGTSSRVRVKDRNSEGVSVVTSERVSDTLPKLYSDLVAAHAELQLNYKRIDEENTQMKERLSDLAKSSSTKDEELAMYKEKVMMLNKDLLASMGKEDSLGGKYVIRTKERDALSKRVKALERELDAQKDINRVQSEQMEELNDRWFAGVAEPEVHAVTQAASVVKEKSNDVDGDQVRAPAGMSFLHTSFDEPEEQAFSGKAMMVIEESHGEIGESAVATAYVTELKRGETPNQNSMIKRLKGKTRKVLLVDDDFEYGSDVKKMKTGGRFEDDKIGYFKDNAEFLAYLDRKHAGHCARSIDTKYLTMLVEKINISVREPVYYNRHASTFVDGRCIMDVLKGVYISNHVVDAYGQFLVKTRDPYKHAKLVTIITGDCWDRVLKRNSKHVVNEVMSAALRNTGLILLPILSTGNTNEVGAPHWSLLIMDVDDQEWRFYNSKRPRTDKTKDKYLGDARLLKEKLEVAMAEKSSVSLGYKVSESDTHLPLVEVPAAQQGETCDCAIYICYFMRQLVRNEELKVKLRKDVVRKFKAEVIESIMK